MRVMVGELTIHGLVSTLAVTYEAGSVKLYNNE